MKVFEIIYEHFLECAPTIIETRLFATAKDDDIRTVLNHYASHCEEMGYSLKGVREVLTISEKLQ